MNDLQAMAVFAAVVQQGSMSGAARQLGMTPSAVSQRVRSLEAAHRVTLLHRSTRRLTLTEVGQRVFAHCESLLRSADGAREQMQLARNVLEGELRISAPTGFARHVASALAPLLEQHRGLTLSLQFDDRLINLVEARIDVALRAGRMPDSTWVARRLCTLEWLLCASPAYLARAGTPQGPSDLAAHQWLGGDLRPGRMAFELTAIDGRVERLQVEPRIVSNNQINLQQLCVAGAGLARLVHSDADDDLRQARLVRLLPHWQFSRTPVWAVTPQRKAQPAKVRHAIAALQQTLRELPGATD
jgi:DNA-binding transcriptional LysR family regulator